jgi:hypothetical protein
VAEWITKVEQVIRELIETLILLWGKYAYIIEIIKFWIVPLVVGMTMLWIGYKWGKGKQPRKSTKKRTTAVVKKVDSPHVRVKTYGNISIKSPK